MTSTFTCRGCGETLEVYAEEGFEQQPIQGLCVSCWDTFSFPHPLDQLHLEEKFEELIA